MLSESELERSPAPHANPAGPRSWKDLEEELVEAVKLSWRLPSGGSSAFATDGPWFLLTDQARAESGWDAWRQEIEAQAIKDMRNSPRTVPLTSVEVDWMNERLGWLELVPERDRRLVVVALCHVAGARSSGGRLSWRRIRETLNRNKHWREVAVSDKGLGMRYSRAIGELVKVVNGLD